MIRRAPHLRGAAYLLAAAVMVTACSDGAPAAEGGARTLSVQISGDDAEAAAIREMTEAFAASRPGVTVNLVAVEKASDHMAKLATAFAGGKAPDVFLLNYRRFGQFASRGVIDPVPTPAGVDLDAEELFAAPREAFSTDGILLCLPQNVSSSVIYLNTDLFAKAGVPLPRSGWTYADALSTAVALKAAGVPAIGFEPVTRTLSSFVWASGGEMVDDTAAPTRTRVDSPAGRRALAFLLDWQVSGLDATARAAEDPSDTFARGELAMFYDSRRAVPSFRTSAVPFDVVGLPLDTEPATLLASDAYCVTRTSTVLDLAHEFAAFAAGGEGGAVLARTGRTVPALKSLASSEAFLAPGNAPASAQVFLDNVAIVRRLPNVATQSAAEKATDQVLEQLFAGRTSLDAAVADIDTASAAAYADTAG